MIRKGNAICMAVNCRNLLIMEAALLAAQQTGSAIILEIAKSEGGVSAYCGVNYWNIALYADYLANKHGITVPICIHADHFTVTNAADAADAEILLPTLIAAGLTSVAIDASKMPDADNLITTLDLVKLLPPWMSLETEVGEIKGKEGLSTPAEALFLIQGLNAYGVFPTWIALNNGTVHGLMTDDKAGIQLELTKRIHEVLVPYHVYGGQHGTSGSPYSIITDLANGTRTTKANVATMLQMMSWGLDLNEFGNAKQDDKGKFIKLSDEGVPDELWAKMVAYADEQGWTGGNYKKLNRPFENALKALPASYKARIVKRLENFMIMLMTDVMNSAGTADLVIDAILEAEGPDLKTKAEQIHYPADWTVDAIREKAAQLEKSTDDGSMDHKAEE
jgi:fructose/tagatose bisphosphate aldolase